MQTTITQVRHRSLTTQEETVSIWTRFMNWCDRQEPNRFGWTAVIIMGHGCIFTVLTVLAIIFTGNHFIFWPFAIAAITAPLITNLAALSTRVIIPVFFLSLLIDLLIIAFSLATGFSVENVYR